MDPKDDNVAPSDLKPAETNTDLVNDSKSDAHDPSDGVFDGT